MKRVEGRWTCLLAWALVVCVGLTFGAVGYLYVAARRAVPEPSGRLSVHGLGQNTDVTRDSHAIVHIRARSVDDAYFGLGFAHAQDRLFQMELARRVASGKLAELIGERGLDSDRLFRTLGLTTVVERNLRALSGETAAALAAYARGVNAFLESNAPLPIELELIQSSPAPWTARDTLLVGKLLAFRLAGNWDNELWRLRLAARLTPRQLEEFTRSDDSRAAVSYEDMWKVYSDSGLEVAAKQSEFAAELGRYAPTGRGRAVGSNSWVVDGRRSRSGKPLLANDPHLELTAPTAWYLAHLSAPGFEVMGATIPGLAGVVIGRNERVAWSFTNLAPDTQDLYFERLVPEGYASPNGPAAFEEREERIAVRWGSDVSLRVRQSRHGPIVSDILREAVTPSGYVLALAWTALSDVDETLRFPLAAARTSTASELRVAASALFAPAQNLVYADIDGAVGFVAAGGIPQRRNGPLRGAVPAPGWTAEFDWDGLIPFEELPTQVQPEQGYLVTANQNTAPIEYPRFLGVDFGVLERTHRIDELLQTTPLHDPTSFAQVQLDTHSAMAQVLLPLLLSQLGDAEEVRAEIVALASWDRNLATTSSAGALCAAWLREFARAVYSDEIGDLFPDESEPRTEFLRAVLTDQGGASRWCDDTRTLAPESCGTMARHSLLSALSYLKQRLGADPSTWTWGGLHEGVALHPLLGDVPILGGLFNVRVPRGGDASSPNVGAYIWNDDAPFENGWGPGLRAIYDLSTRDRALGILSTGQSGHVMSPHYRDMVAPWQHGELLTLSMRAEEFGRNALGTWTLEPIARTEP